MAPAGRAGAFKGASSLEYAITVALIAAAAIGAVMATGDWAVEAFESAAARVGTPF